MIYKNIAVALGVSDVGKFVAAFGVAGGAVKEFGATVNAQSAQVQAATRQIGTAMAAVGVATVAAIAASTGAAAALETRMQNVATIWNDSSVSIAEAGQRVIDMSTRLPQSANNLAEGLYDVASSGFQGAAGLEVLEAAGTAASAGLTTTATAAKGIAAVLNAYGQTADQATHVSDVLFQTVNLGVVTFDELSNSLGNFIGTASTAGVSIEDAASAYATMTLAGLNADEASTSLNRTLQAFIQPGTEMAAVLQQMGYTSGVVAIEELGLQGVMERLAEVVGRDNVEAFALLFPEMRGLRGALALLAADGQNYERVSEGMANAANATRDALEQQAKSASFQFNILKNTVVALAISFGQALLPYIKAAITVFQFVADIFSQLPGPIQAVIAAGAALTGIAIGLTGAFVLLAPAITATGVAMGVLSGGAVAAAWAIRGLLISLAPFAPILVAIGAVVGVAAFLWSRHAKAQADNKRSVDELKDSLDAETGATTAATDAILAKRIVTDDLDKKAQALGISIGTLTGAMVGNKAAVDEVNRATRGAGKDGEQLRSVVAKTSQQLDDAKAKWDRDSSVKGAAAAATRKLSAEQEKAVASAESMAAAQKNLAAAIQKMFDPGQGVSSAADRQREAEEKRTDAVKEQLRKRHDAENQALEDQQQAEKRSLDRHGDERKKALDRIHDAELNGLEAENRDYLDALDERHRLVMGAYDLEVRGRKEALDRQFRDEKEALNRQFRAEQDALDDRLSLLNDEYDQRRKNEKRRYEAEKDEVQAMVDSTFGTEREGWKARLVEIEDAHDSRLNALDRQQDDEKRTEKNGLEDRQQQVKDALADRQQTIQDGLTDELDTIKRNLDDQYQAEKRSLEDRYTQRVEQAKARQEVEKDALETELTDLSDNLARRQQALKNDRQERQRADDAAAETRRSSAKQQDELRLGDLQVELDKQLVAQRQMLDNLAVIARRGGESVNFEMLEQLQKLPPSIVAQLAATGQPAFDRFLDTFRQGMATVNLLDIARGGVPMGEALANGMAQGWYQKFATTPVVGGLLQGVRIPGFAEGHYAEIAMGGPRLWAEPETGGEAYIPLAPSKRGRSAQILGLTAAHFGYGLTRMANGGIITPAGAAGGTNVTVYVENHLAPGIDMGVAGRIISQKVREGVDAALDDLGRRVITKSWGGR